MQQPDLLLGGAALGDVLGDDQPRHPALERESVTCHLHVDQRGVLLLVLPDSEVARARSDLSDFADQRRDVPGRADVLDRHLQELFAGVSVVPNRSVVDLEKAQGLDVEKPLRQRAVLEQDAIARLILAQRPLRPAMRRADLALAQLALHRRWKPRKISLEHIILRAGAHRLDGVVLSDCAGDDDERQVRLRRPDDGQGIAPAEAGHRPIADHQVPGMPRQRGDEWTGLFDALVLRLEAARHELAHEQLGVVRRILDDHHL